MYTCLLPNDVMLDLLDLRIVMILFRGTIQSCSSPVLTEISFPIFRLRVLLISTAKVIIGYLSLTNVTYLNVLDVFAWT